MGGEKEGESSGRASGEGSTEAPLKKRRLVNGQELVFKRPGEEEDEDGSGGEGDVGPVPTASKDGSSTLPDMQAVPVVEAQRIIIHEDD